MRLFLLAAAGGAIGSGLRYLVSVFAARFVAVTFPWSTLFVNVVGSFLIGLAAEWALHRLGGTPEWRTFLATGVLGGFTTFSAFALDTAALWRTGASASAVTYVAASVVVSLAAVFAGIAAGRALLLVR